MSAGTSTVPDGEARGVPTRGGLDGVVVAQTSISFPDSVNRRLVVRGRDLRDLIDAFGYEQLCTFLWQEPTTGAPEAAPLGEARVRAFRVFQPLCAHLGGLDPLSAMQFLFSSLPRDAAGGHMPADLVAAVGVAAALGVRASGGSDPIAPAAALSHATDLLRMMGGDEGDARKVRALEIYLVAMAEHGLNVSTFAARVVASTRAGLKPSVLAALSAFGGPLHGGAPSLVLDMLDEIGPSAGADAVVARKLERGERIFGFGSRGYDGRDPRTDLFKASHAELFGRTERFDAAAAAEAAILGRLRLAKPGRAIETNVEYYGALLLEAIGIPRCGFTPVFAAARCAGWIAHSHEEALNGRLMRPAARYVGAVPDPRAWPADT